MSLCSAARCGEASMFMNVQDLIQHGKSKVKLIDILVFLNCSKNNDEENWPDEMCSSCVSTTLGAYNFKLNCLKTNSTLSQILNTQASPTHIQRSELDDIISAVYQDHEYDVPLFSNHATLDFDDALSVSNTKELTPLPPVTEITSAEQLPRKEGDKKFSCTVCAKSFTRIFALRDHMAKHTDTRKYLCSKCGKTFHTPNGLRQHFNEHKETTQFKCGFCNKTYKYRQSLNEHFRLEHSTNRKQYVCVPCGKSYSAKSTLMEHNKTHNGERFACPHCPKTYTRALYLRNHILAHTGQERPKRFVCNHIGCDRKFATKYSLMVHIAHTHNADRPYKCAECSKGFPTPNGLKVHMESHSNKELLCNICFKKFGNKRVLQKHLRQHDDDANDMILETVVDNVFFEQVY